MNSTTTCTGVDPQVCITEYSPDLLFVLGFVIFLLGFPVMNLVFNSFLGSGKNRTV